MSRQRSTTFDVRIDGRPILEVEPRGGVRANITYRVVTPGIVPPFEEHLARLDLGYTVEKWEELDPKSRAYEVALRRLKAYVELHQSDAASDKAERDAKLKGNRGLRR